MSDTEPQMQFDDAAGASSGPQAEAEKASKPSKTKKDKTRRGHLPRRISAWVLVVLAAILIPVSVLSVWAIRTVTNTDQYVETMAPLARNPVIVDGLATRATDALFSTHIVQNKVTDALPKSAKPLVAPIVNEVHSYVYGLALKVFSSPKFGKLWDTLNRHSHEAVINILTGKQTPLQKKVAKGGQIAINLSPTLNTLISDLDAHGVTLFNPLKAVSTQGVSFTVVSKQQVSKFSGLFNLVVKFKWIIPVVALVLAILAVALAMERRKTLLRLAVGVALMSLLVLAGLSAGRRGWLQLAGCRRRVGHRVALPQVGPALDAADLGTGRLRRLAGRAGPLRRVDPQDLRIGWPLGRRPGPRVVVGYRPCSRRVGPGAPHRRLDRRAPQRPAHRRGCRGGSHPGLRREHHRVEPVGDRDRARCVSRRAAVDRGVGPQGGGSRVRGCDRDRQRR